MAFYTFSQNNSGGSFDHDAKAGIGYCVCVEATSPDEAVARAERIGVYFNGCDSGMDCPCCGDRWSDYLGKDDATAEPEKYGSPLTGGWGIPSYVHYLDGRIEARPDGDA
jgi:hypothetical protein